VVPVNGGKDAFGKIILAPFKTTGNYWLKGLLLEGFSTYADEGLGQSSQGRTVARGNARFTWFGAQTTNGDRTRYGGDLQWAVGPAALRFEYLEVLNQRKHLATLGRSLDDVDASGWFISGAYILTGENKVLNGPVEPRHPFSPFAGKAGLGAWEVTLRYAELTFDSKDPLNFLGGTGSVPIGPATTDGAESITAGVNWYLNRWTRWMVNFNNYWYDNPYATPLSCRRQVACTTTSPTVSQLHRRHDPTSYELLTRMAFWF
jgi:phosphate-selective porin